MTLDWSRHRFAPVACTYTPRHTYDGRPLKPGMAEAAGMEFELVALWQMGHEDPYPDEYALSTKDSRLLEDAIGVLWIASGDVTPKDTA